MVFTWLNKQGVQSDDGFAVQFTGRFSAEYREGARVIKIHVENGVMGKRPCISIKKNAFDRWSDNAESVPIDKQLQILKNFREAMEFQGLALFVE